jgi:hypothetical protein
LAGYAGTDPRIDPLRETCWKPCLESLERHGRSLLTHPWSVRLDVGNVTNTRGLSLGWDYSAVPQLSRNCTLTLAVDL